MSGTCSINASPIHLLSDMLAAVNNRPVDPMPQIPQRFAPFAYGIIQAAITTAVATAIATHQLTGFGADFMMRWIFAWVLAWATMLPVVIVIAPVIQRAVRAMTIADR